VSGHTIQWVTASPLWPDVVQSEPAAVETRARMRRPALLRFASDSFMDDLVALLDAHPDNLAELEARHESFRPPPPGEGPDWEPAAERLKLYQAVHGRFYMIAATLTCRAPGLPEHPADSARGETVSFVLRRNQDGGEWAWLSRPAGGTPKWAPVPAGREAALATGEDQLPLFPLNYDHAGRHRRLYVGLVPTSSRETFAAAGPLSPLQPEPVPEGQTSDPRRLALEATVLVPMREMPKDPHPPTKLTGTQLKDATDRVAEKRREMSQMALAELIGLLRGTIPEVFNAITMAGAPLPTGGAKTLYDRFGTERAGPAGHPTWRQALKTAWEEHLAIAGEEPGRAVTLRADLSLSTLSAAALGELFANALPPLASPAGAAGASAATGPPVPPEVPKLDARGEAVYVLRCVYRRPECGPLQPDVVSDPTREFTIAPFYDLDAPVRPLMISLPIDTSLKDLRRFRKGVSFLISDQLRKQMSRASSLKDAMDGNVASGEQFSLGLICSFSIPIITIVALILMLMIVSLLNFVFGWMPYLRICFPIGLKGKE
jgi:hypothetical protein